MAGLPWVVVFGLLAWVAAARGWGVVFALSAFCAGIFAADTAVGEAIASGATAALSGAYRGITSMLSGVAR